MLFHLPGQVCFGKSLNFASSGVSKAATGSVSFVRVRPVRRQQKSSRPSTFVV